VLSTSTPYLSASGGADRHCAPPILPAIAIAIAKNRIGDPAAPAARAGRTAPCSRQRAHHAARASRAKIPSDGLRCDPFGHESLETA
jgi:hypothetical protein